MKILFIGGTAFFGKSFLSYFQNFILPKNKNANLVIASRNPESILDYVNHKYLGNSITLESIDILTCNALPESDLVIHAAAYTNESSYIDNPEKERENIIKGTHNIVNLISKESKFIYVSSGAVYGKQMNIVPGFDENKETRVYKNHDVKSIYSSAKIEAEKVVISISKRNNIRSIIARCFSFIGCHLPLNQHFVIGNIINSVLNKSDFLLKSKKRIYRSYMDSHDLSRALIFISKFASENTEIFNIGSNEVIEIHELAHELSCKYNFDIRGEKEADCSVESDIYIPNISKLLSSGYKLEYTIQNSINKIIKNIKL